MGATPNRRVHVLSPELHTHPEGCNYFMNGRPGHSGSTLNTLSTSFVIELFAFVAGWIAIKHDQEAYQSLVNQYSIHAVERSPVGDDFRWRAGKILFTALTQNIIAQIPVNGVQMKMDKEAIEEFFRSGNITPPNGAGILGPLIFALWRVTGASLSYISYANRLTHEEKNQALANYDKVSEEFKMLKEVIDDARRL